MKKLFSLLVVALVSTTSIFAQSKLVATLTHGDIVTVFYEANAFAKAHDAATSGDVITLSEGEFNSFTITKAVTIRGTGIDAASPTRVGEMTLEIPESDTNHFSIEGVRFNTLTLKGSCIEPTFLKCQINRMYAHEGSIKDAIFVNCKFTDIFQMGGSTTAKFSHCYVNWYENESNYTSEAQFLNCVIGGYLYYFRRSTFINSIICGSYGGDGSGRLPAEAIAMNCIALCYSVTSYGDVYYNTDIYSDMQGSQVSCSTSTYEEIFKEYKASYADSQTFELTDEAKTKFLGTDGKEIGLYGGQYPYTSTPAYPRITKLNVAKQATADDKLSVEIEVSAVE